MSTAAMAWRPLYDADETAAQYAARQRQAFAAFELAWREGRVSLKLKGYYDQLVRDVGANAYAWWTEERWADAFGVSASTIKRVLSALTKAGLIRRERQFGSSSRTFLTSYDRPAAAVQETVSECTDNHNDRHSRSTTLLSRHEIRHDAGEDTSDRASNQNPEDSENSGKVFDYRQPDGLFLGTRSDPTIGSVVRRDHVKNRHLTIGAAGEQPPAAVVDGATRQFLEREGVVDFVLAPLLAQQAVEELQVVSQYLDSQHTVRDRPRLFAWLVTHGFGRQLLTGRGRRSKHPTRAPRGHPLRPPATALSPSDPARPPTPHAAVWEDLRDRLRADPAALAIQVWLDDLVLLDLTATTAVVGTPNVFVRDAVANHATVVAAQLAPMLGHQVTVNVVVDG